MPDPKGSAHPRKRYPPLSYGHPRKIFNKWPVAGGDARAKGASLPRICVKALAHLLVCVVGVDVFQRRRHQLRRELCRHPDGQRHPALQGRVGKGAVLVVVIVVADLIECNQSIIMLVSVAGTPDTVVHNTVTQFMFVINVSRFERTFFCLPKWPR